MSKILIIFGTRPELIKLAPIISEFENRGVGNRLIIINTNQHSSLLREIVEDFDIAIDNTLEINNRSNNLAILSSEITIRLEHLLKEINQKDTISSVIVQGDTTSSFCASLVAFYNKIPIHYVEAGLRTYDNSTPFPEEFYRRVISHAAEYLYAPTESAKKNLLEEGFKHDKIIVTGNTVIDSILLMDKLNHYDGIDDYQNTILCTIHRRENHGSNIVIYINSIVKLAFENPEYNFVIIRHPNPEIMQVLDRHSSTQSKNLTISDPLPYSKILNLIRSSRLIISDSGGLQEEASFFLKPIIVLRNSTERIESIRNNIAVCVTSEHKNLDSQFKRMIGLKIDESNKFLYGEGNAAKMIVDNILRSNKK